MWFVSFKNFHKSLIFIRAARVTTLITSLILMFRVNPPAPPPLCVILCSIVNENEYMYYVRTAVLCLQLAQAPNWKLFVCVCMFARLEGLPVPVRKQFETGSWKEGKFVVPNTLAPNEKRTSVFHLQSENNRARERITVRIKQTGLLKSQGNPVEKRK